MRVNRRIRRDDRGTVLIIAAVFVIVAVVFLAFVVDVGNQRQDRRQLTTATDAAALDVAQRWARGSLEPTGDDYAFSLISAGLYDCTDEAQAYLDRNRVVDAGDYRCEAAFKNDQLASVSVFADGTTTYQIGQAVGVDEGSIASTTSVRIRSTIGGGLRPFAICARDTDVLAWYNSGGLPAGQQITLGGDKFLPQECGQNNANWGFIVYDTQDEGQKSLAEVIRDGTLDPVSSFDNGDQGDPLDPYADEKAVCVADADAPGENPQELYDDQDPVTCIFNEQGAAGWQNNNALDAFDYLIDNQITFSLPLYGQVQPIANGQQTGFPVIGFAEVRMVSYSPAQGANENEITLEFLGLSTGDCCDVNDSNYALEICDVGTTGGGVLASFTAECQTADATSGPGNPVPPGSQPCRPVGVTPATQSAARVTDNGPNKDKLLTPAIYVLEVEDAANCGEITAIAEGGNGQPPETPPGTAVGNLYTLTFPALADKFTQPAYTVRFLEDGQAMTPDMTAALLLAP